MPPRVTDWEAQLHRISTQLDAGDTSPELLAAAVELLSDIGSVNPDRDAIHRLADRMYGDRWRETAPVKRTMN